MNLEALAVLSSQSCPFSDLTPELQQKLLANMHLREFGPGERPMRTDERETVRSVSDSDGVYGTPKYMAPEQFGEKPCDWRVDLYGLACVAFEALSGRRVIEAADLLGIIQEKLRFVVPPRQSIGHGVTIEMHELLVRGLDCRPENRAIDLRRLAGPVQIELPPANDDRLNETKGLSPTW